MAASTSPSTSSSFWHLLPELFRRNDKRRCNNDDIFVAVGGKSLCHQFFADAAHHAVRILSIRHKGFFGGLVLYQLYAGEQADIAHITHTGVLCLQILQQLAQHLAGYCHIVQDVCLLVVVDTGNTSGTRQRMRTVGQTAGQIVVVKVCGDLLADSNAAQLDIAAGHALCKGMYPALHRSSQRQTSFRFCRSLP